MTAHALFIGINTYTDRNVPALQCAQRDASELYHLFKHRLGYGEHAHLLEGPRQEDVHDQLDAIGRQVRANDSFLLYFAGHGVESADGQDQYLLLGGARMLLLQRAQGGVPAGTLSVCDLVAFTDAWPRVQRVMVFDACRTRLVPTMGLPGLPVFGSEKLLQQIATRDMGFGGASPAQGARPAATAQPAATAAANAAATAAANAKLPTPPVFIKSCQSGELAVELTAHQRSMFGLAFDQVLNQALNAGQAVLTNPGLLQALAERMARLAADHSVGAGQRPWMSNAGVEAPVYVPSRPAARPPPVPPPPVPDPVPPAPQPLPPHAQALTQLMEDYERQLTAGQLQWPAADCCVGTLALMRAAGLGAGSLGRYERDLQLALNAKLQPSPPPPPPPPTPPPVPGLGWQFRAGASAVAALGLVAVALVWAPWAKKNEAGPPAAVVTPSATVAAPQLQVEQASGAASYAGTVAKAPAPAVAPQPAPAPTPAAEPYPLVDGMAPAGLKQLQAAAAQRAGLAEVRFTDRLANGQAGPVMVVVPAGRFQMGSAGGDDNEKRVRPGVRVDGFALMQTEVTVGQYLACVADGGCAEPQWREAGSQYHYQSGSEEYYKRLGASLTDPRSPVVGVSWQNAGHYAAWLSKGTNRGYRLPTEAEWEYAARAGSPGKWSFGDDESQLGQYAWYYANSGGQLKPVGTKQANPWQLKDLHGSVWEWVQDCYHGNYSGAPETGAEWQVNCADTRRVVRGGAWNNSPDILRSAFRNRFAPDFRFNYMGFRLARTF